MMASEDDSNEPVKQVKQENDDAVPKADHSNDHHTPTIRTKVKMQGSDEHVGHILFESVQEFLAEEGETGAGEVKDEADTVIKEEKVDHA